jgi:hypothetical protein
MVLLSLVFWGSGVGEVFLVAFQKVFAGAFGMSVISGYRYVTARS